MWKEAWIPWKDDDFIPKVKSSAKNRSDSNIPYWLKIKPSTSQALPDLDPTVETPYAGGDLRERMEDPAFSKLWTNFSDDSTTDDDLENGKEMYSKKELEKLYDIALDFSGRIMTPFRYVYRCKPKCYWDDIHNRTNGIMEIYLKDNTGHEGSPINGRLHGLFFSPNPDPEDGGLPDSSAFGEIRFVMNPRILLDPMRYNMYFTDFYCTRLSHYLTIVICEKDSYKDKFCKEHLKSLDPLYNNFLHIDLNDYGDDYVFSVNTNVMVEVFYTENIPLSWGKFDTVEVTGTGSSKIEGLGHNKHCTTCNLHLMERIKEEVLDDEEETSGVDERGEESSDGDQEEVWEKIGIDANVNGIWDKVEPVCLCNQSEEITPDEHSACQSATKTMKETIKKELKEESLETTEDFKPNFNQQEYYNHSGAYYYGAEAGCSRSSMTPAVEESDDFEPLIDGKHVSALLNEFCTYHKWKLPDFNCKTINQKGIAYFLWNAVINGVTYEQEYATTKKKDGKVLLCRTIIKKLRDASS